MTAGQTVEISILGALRVRVAGADLTGAVPAQLQPLLVALALVDGPVPKRELARDVLYLSPATVDSRLSRLRGVLGLLRPLHRASPPRSGNIELDRSVARVDADEYRRRATLGAPADRDPRDALTELLRTDDLWGGPPVGAHALGDVDASTAVGRGRHQIMSARECVLTGAARLALRHGLPIDDERLAAWTRERPDLDVVWFARVALTHDALGPAAAHQVLDEWDAQTATHDRSLRGWAGHVVAAGRVGTSRVVAREPDAGHAVVPIGREGPVASLDTLLAAIASGASELAVIQGAAGTGKSRLLAYAQERAIALGMRVGAADVEERVGLSDVLRTALGPVWNAALRDPEPSPALRRRVAALAALLGPSALDAVDGSTREPVDPVAHATDLALELLTFTTRDQPLLLVLDNVHRAEPALIGVVEALHGARVPALGVLLTSREPLLAGSGTHDAITHVHLGELDREGAHRFLVEMRGRALAPDALTELTTRVSATPLGLLTADLDRLPDGVSSAADAMAATLHTRAPDTRRAIAVAAISTHGTACDEQLVDALAGGADWSAALAREAARGEILRSTPDGLAFTHRLWQEVAYAALDPSDRRRLHGLAVRHLGDRIDRACQSDELRGLALRLAEHARRCDLSTIDRVRAVQTLTRAADLLQPVDAGQADDLYGLAIGTVTEPTLATALHLHRARLRWQTADWSGAHQDLTQTRQLAGAIGDLKTSAEAMLITAHVTWEPTHADELADDLDHLLELLPADERLLRARVQACLAGGLYQDGSTATGRDAPALARAALATLDALAAPPDPEIEAELLWWVRKGLLDVESPEACAALSSRLQDVAGRSEHHLGNGLLAAIVDSLVLGRTKRARAMSGRYTELADTTGAPLPRYVAATLAGVWALYDGRFDDVVLATAAAEQEGAFGGVTATQVIEGQRVCIARDRGQFRERPDLVALVEALTPVDGPIPIWSAAGAWLKADAGDTGGAVERLGHIAALTGDLAEIPRGPHRLPLLAFVAEVLAEVRARSDNTASGWLTRLATRAYAELEQHPGAGVLLGWPVAYLGSKQRYLGLAAAAAGRAQDALGHLGHARRIDGARTPLGVRNGLALARLGFEAGETGASRRAARACRLRATDLGMTGVAHDARALEDASARQ